MNDEKDLEMPVAKNAPGFDDAPGPEKGGEDRVYEFSADLNISPVKDLGETDENGIPTSVPIQIVTKKFSPKLPPKTPTPAPVANNAFASAFPSKPPETAPESTPTHTSSVLPTTPGQEPRPTDVERPMANVSPEIPSNIPNREKIFTPPPAAQVQPVPAAPQPIQNQAPAGQFVEKPKPIATFNLDGTLATPPPAPASTIPADSKIPRDPNLKPLRTYEGDVAEAMAREQASMATIAVAESNKRQQAEAQSQQEPEPTHGSSATKIFIVLLIIIFIGTGVIGAFYLYSKSPLAPVTPTTIPQNAPASLIPSDSYILLATDNLPPISLKNAFAQELKKTQDSGTIKEVIATKIVTGETMRVGGPEIISLLDIPMPNLLLRSLGQASMLGIYANPDGENDVFVVMSSDFFQNSFAGMLQWESVMADDLKFYLFDDSVQGVANVTDPMASGAATTTSETGIRPYPTIRGHFVDRIIKNKDVREFQDDNGNILFLYSFVDNTKLVLTTAESTLAEIISRLEKAAGVR